MSYLLLAITAFGLGLQSLISKQYNVRVKKPNTYLYSAMVAITAMIFFVLTSGGDLKFNSGIIGYSLMFAISYSMAMIGSIQAINCGPLSISVMINQCSLILPTLYGIIFLKEDIGVFGYIGIALLLGCLWLVKPKTVIVGQEAADNTKVSSKWFMWVTMGFLGNGMCSITQKMEQLAFDGAYKNEFMIIALIIGAAVMLIAAAANGKGVVRDILPAMKFAPLQGLANGIVNLLVMVLAAYFPTAVLFPVILSGGIVIAFAASITVFKEKLTKQQYFGYLLGVVSIILVNI